MAQAAAAAAAAAAAVSIMETQEKQNALGMTMRQHNLREVIDKVETVNDKVKAIEERIKKQQDAGMGSNIGSGGGKYIKKCLNTSQFKE